MEQNFHSPEGSLRDLHDLVQLRKTKPEEGSYTSYLFSQGIDKILKKCGEECSEMIIAAKNHDNTELANEMSDLIYHMMVLMVEAEMPLEDVFKVLEERRQKIGNLKQFHQTDKNS